ncbi:MAG: hypothetical protein ACM3Q1_04700 [Bacteroidales bacterium]
MRIGAIAAAGLLLAAGAARADGIDYRGRTITQGASPSAAACVALVRKGIDLVEGMPANLRSLGKEVTRLRCDPVTPGAQGTGTVDNTTGTYVLESREEAKGFILFRRDPAALAASNVAMSLIGNGVYARRHREWVEGRRKLAKSNDPALKAKVERLEKIMTKSDVNLTVKAECELLDVQYQTMKALKADAEDLSALSRLMLRRGCD